MPESKRERFIRIAEARTNKIIDMIQLLGNCSNRATYDYTEKDITDIFSTIKKELDLARQKYSVTEDKQSKFKLER